MKQVELSKQCPICEVQIHKSKPYLSLRKDKALQSLVYKLVPGLYKEEMDRRRKFTEIHEPTKVSKEELEKHFFFRDDKISMSLQYYDPKLMAAASEAEAIKKSNGKNGCSDGEDHNMGDDGDEADNPNKRYLACPGTVKVHHLKKFVTMKYGLNLDTFVVDVIYKGDIIPEDYTLIDVAYYYKWGKVKPMQFFYRIFKKNKVLLKRRKRKSRTEDKISDGRKPRPVENNLDNAKSKSFSKEAGKGHNNNNNNTAKGGSASATSELVGCRTVSGGAAASSSSKKGKSSSSYDQPPALKDETKPPPTKMPKLEPEKLSNNANAGPPTLTAAVSLNPGKKEFKMRMESPSPPPEKKLKIDIKDESKDGKESIKVNVSTTNVSKKSNSMDGSVTSANSSSKPKTLSGLDQLSSGKKQQSSSPSPPALEAANKASPKPSQQQQVLNSMSPRSPPAGGKPLLTDIVNNLKKKQEAVKPEKLSVSMPASLLGGQTTITKKTVVSPSSDSNKIKKAEDNSSSDSKSSAVKAKGIPQDTSITVKNVYGNSNNLASATTTGSGQKSSHTVSFTNSLKTSMMNFVQSSKPNGLTTTTTPSSTSSSTTSNVNKSPTVKSSLSDLRNFRKSHHSSGDAAAPSGGGSPKASLQRPIIPCLTKKPNTTATSPTKTTSNNVNNTKNLSFSNSTAAMKLNLSSPKLTSNGGSALSKPIPKHTSPPSAASTLLPATTASTVAAAAMAEQLAVAASALNPTLNPFLGLAAAAAGAGGAAGNEAQLQQMMTLLAASTAAASLPRPAVTMPSQAQRLQVKVQTSSNSSTPSSTGSASTTTSASPTSKTSLKSPVAASNSALTSASVAAAAAASGLNLPPSMFSHIAQLHSSLTANGTTTSGSTPTSGGLGMPKLSSLPKTQRHIPNPSLLTKQNSDRDQQAAAQQRLIQQALAAATAEAAARSALSK